MPDNNHPAELNEVIKKVSEYIDLSVTPFGQEVRSVVRIDKRDPMYGGSGVVYLFQMFAAQNELVNNRIGAYMVLLTDNDESGFHTHGDRKEQELYIVINGEGEYSDRDGNEGKIRTQKIRKGSVMSVQGSGQHSVKNTGTEPLIIFVITTNEKAT